LDLLASSLKQCDSEGQFYMESDVSLEFENKWSCSVRKGGGTPVREVHLFSVGSETGFLTKNTVVFSWKRVTHSFVRRSCSCSCSLYSACTFTFAFVIMSKNELLHVPFIHGLWFFSSFLVPPSLPPDFIAFLSKAVILLTLRCLYNTPPQDKIQGSKPRKTDGESDCEQNIVKECRRHFKDIQQSQSSWHPSMFYPPVSSSSYSSLSFRVSLLFLVIFVLSGQIKKPSFQEPSCYL